MSNFITLLKNHQWENRSCVAAIPEIMERAKKEPDYFNNNKGGRAIWNDVVYNGITLLSIEIADMQKKHNHPKGLQLTSAKEQKSSACCCMYVTIAVPLEKSKCYDELLKNAYKSCYITFLPEMNRITVCCKSLEHAMILFSVATGIAVCRLSIQETQVKGFDEKSELLAKDKQSIDQSVVSILSNIEYLQK